MKQIREASNYTMEKFGEKLGVTKAAISRLEKGERNITDQMVYSICRAFNVDETWFRTGEGDMFLDVSREEEIAKLTKTLLFEESDSFKNRLISVLARLTEEQWSVLAEIADAISKKNEE